MKTKLLLIVLFCINIAKVKAQNVLIPNGGFNIDTAGWTIEGLNTTISSNGGMMTINIADIYAEQFILKSPQFYLEANKIYKLFTDYSCLYYDPVTNMSFPMQGFSNNFLKNSTGISAANVDFVTSVGGGALTQYKSATFSVSSSGIYYLEYQGEIAPELLFQVDNVGIEGLFSHKFSGNITSNINNDGCATSNIGMSNVNVQVNQASSNVSCNATSDANGNFSINTTDLALGNYITQINEPFYTATPANYVNLITDVISNFPNQNFCVSPNAIVNDVMISIIPTTEARPGFNTSYRLRIKNMGTTTLSGAVVLNYDNTKVTFLSAVPTSNSSTSTSLIWNYVNLMPLETQYINVTFTVFTTPTVNNGDILNYTATVSPSSGDYSPQNNINTLNQITIGSYDPNDITFLEGPNLSTSQASEYVNVLIRFQNTGTASAININVNNTLDALLDWTTFETIAASHSYSTIIRNGNELTFAFNGINLPDSTTNEPASQGWILYKIKPKTTFTIGDIISNIAQIYFDYNLPIITNTATIQINNALSNSNNYLTTAIKIYPNPAENIVMVDINSAASYSLFNLRGQLMHKGELKIGKNQLNLSNLSSGLYLLKTTTLDGKTAINKLYIK